MDPRDVAAAARSIVGEAHVRSAAPADAIRGQVPGLVVEPANAQDVAAVLRMADAARLAVIPRGAGTKLDWGNPPARADLILSTRRLDRVVDHAWADLTVVVEAGCTMTTLQDALRLHGQRVAVDALWPGRATVGGVLASNDSGALRLRFGGLRDLIIGVTIALPDGTIATSGGRVVKNVAGYDLPKLMTGAFGTLGVITRAIFRLHPLPRRSRTLSVVFGDLSDAQHVLELIQDSRLVHTALQLRASATQAPAIDVLFEGSDAGIAAQSAELQALLGPVPSGDGSPELWQAREELWSADGGILKLSVPMTEIGAAIARIRDASPGLWRAVFYPTGLGWIAVASSATRMVVDDLRQWTTGLGGSCVLLRPAAGAERVDTWGSFGDAAPLMQNVRRQFDPEGTINPGRFVDPGA